jgi:hypothetical protein
MKPSEAAVILTKIAAYDRRTVGDSDAAAWAEALDGLVTVQDALTAVRDHFRESNDWLMPKHIIDRAKKIRVQRIRDAGVPDFPAGLDQAAERKWLRYWHDGLSRYDGDAGAAQGLADRYMNVSRVESKPVDPERVRQIVADAGKRYAIEATEQRAAWDRELQVKP